MPEVHILEDGDAIVLKGRETIVERNAVDGGYVYLDGSTVGDVQGAVLRDRGHLADDGVVIVTIALDHKTGEIVRGPDLDSHGFMDEPDVVLDKASEAVRQAILEFEHDSSDETEYVAIRRAARKIIKAETGRRPVVLPVILDV